jgi:HEAT repeat protein
VPEPQTAAKLLEALDNPDAFVRSTTAFALDVRLVDSQIFVPKLADVVNRDTAPLVRLAAVEALWRFGPKAQSAIPALERALADVRPEVRRAAALTLGNLGELAGASTVSLGKSLYDSHPRVREAAAGALQKIQGNQQSEKLNPAGAWGVVVWQGPAPG